MKHPFHWSVIITWKRFVISHSSSSISEFRMTFIPEMNCNFSSSFTTVLKLFRVSIFLLVSQHASEFWLFSPKNKFPFESMAEAADWVPFEPSILKELAYADSSSLSQAVLLPRMLSCTEFSFSDARAWKNNERFVRLLLSIAIPKIPSISSNDSPEIVCVPKVGKGYINSVGTREKLWR